MQNGRYPHLPPTYKGGDFIEEAYTLTPFY